MGATGEGAVTPSLLETSGLFLILCSRVEFSCSFLFLAPEAQRETVFVCAACNSALIKLQ